MMRRIEALPRDLNPEQQAKKTEGLRRERWEAFFGSLYGYRTEWRDPQGFDHLYRDEASQDLYRDEASQDEQNFRPIAESAEDSYNQSQADSSSTRLLDGSDRRK